MENAAAFRRKGAIGEICCGTEVKMEVRCPVELAENAVNTVKKDSPI